MSDLFPTQTRRIGAHSYKIRQLDAVTGRRALFRLTKIAGPAIAAGQEKESIATALAELVTNMNEADLDFFYDLFAERTEVSGGTYHPDATLSLDADQIKLTHFIDRYFEMCEWLVFCFEANFAGFFREALAKLAEMGARAAKKASETAGASTGSPSAKK